MLDGYIGEGICVLYMFGRVRGDVLILDSTISWFFQASWSERERGV